jgi:hypothetical protein
VSRQSLSGSAHVVAVCRSHRHQFSKQLSRQIELVEGHGVAGDCHAGSTVQHLSRVRRDPTQPNLRQVHLIGAELLDELGSAGYVVRPGDLGENIVTTGISLLDLPTGARLALGGEAVVEITGLRNPCLQIERFQTGLLAQVVGRDPHGDIERRAGVMGVVVVGGSVRGGDPIAVRVPAGLRRALRPV